MPDRSTGTPSLPVSATLGRNGTVAVLLARTGSDLHVSRRLLIVRANGTSVILRSESPEATNAFRRFLEPSACMTESRDCPSFENVALARDGTPFVTLRYALSGAYSGVSKAALVWNGAWHVVPLGKPFSGVGKPDDPDNVSIAAADTPTSFAFIGDFYDRFPDEDLDLASRDRYYMANVSGVEYGSLTAALGIGDATAMRGVRCRFRCSAQTRGALPSAYNRYAVVVRVLRRRFAPSLHTTRSGSRRCVRRQFAGRRRW